MSNSTDSTRAARYSIVSNESSLLPSRYPLPYDLVVDCGGIFDAWGYLARLRRFENNRPATIMAVSHPEERLKAAFSIFQTMATKQY